MSDLAAGKISFFQKNDTKCPVCEGLFKKEELRVGGGRLIAGNLGDDLRRYYEASKKFGEVHPLIYYVTTCPFCFYSALSSDFMTPDPKALGKLAAEADERRAAIEKVLPNLDFTQPKGLKEGAAGYFLALMCYQHFSPQLGPTFKTAVCALRTAWLCTDLHRKFPGENYDYLAKIFFYKARFLYMQTIDNEQTGAENVGGIQNFGPDVDNNFGFDGVMYLAGYLEFHYGNHSSEEARARSLGSARRAIARLVGMGKSSKSKPSALLEKAKDLHHQMGEEINE